MQIGKSTFGKWGFISKLPIAKTLPNLWNLAKRKTYLWNLAKLVFVNMMFARFHKMQVLQVLLVSLGNKRKLQNLCLQNLAKLIFAKSCKTLYLWNLAKLVFAKLGKHDLRNNAKHQVQKLQKLQKLRCTEKLWSKSLWLNNVKQHFYNSIFTSGSEPETMLRQTYWDATTGNRCQSPAPYHRKHWRTFLPVPHAPSGYGARAPRGRSLEALGGSAAAASSQGFAYFWQVPQTQNLAWFFARFRKFSCNFASFASFAIRSSENSSSHGFARFRNSNFKLATVARIRDACEAMLFRTWQMPESGTGPGASARLLVKYPWKWQVRREAARRRRCTGLESCCSWPSWSCGRHRDWQRSPARSRRPESDSYRHGNTVRFLGPQI